MSEGNPNVRPENAELASLLRELESQIEGVNAGLSRIRGTVARINYATLGTAAPSAGTWGGAPANQMDWQRQAARPVETPAVPDAPVEPVASSPAPTFAPDFPSPFASSEESEEAPAGFWTSIAEGASWPRSHEEAGEDKEPAPETMEWWGGEASDASLFEAEKELAGADEAASLEASMPAEMKSDDQAEPATESGTLEAADVWSEAPLSESAPSLDNSEPEAPEAAVPPISNQADAAPNLFAKDLDSKPESQDGLPSSLSGGWPDESAWSQSFEWEAMKPATEEPASAENNEDHVRADVSDIVAQVRAELSVARSEGVDLAPDWQTPSESELEASTQAEPQAEVWSAEAAPPEPEMDDEARRDEVSRAVAEIRQQIASGDFESVMRDHGADESYSHAETQDPAAQNAPAEESDDDVRSEVRRAVEATRDELAGGIDEALEDESKPAFKLAAPGTLPDWSHMQVEPSGPPVVVLKDVDGRVELASVYETLNELGCGDGAALLNYTPHSVTVGLPMTAQFPTKEQMAQAVEKVFGLSSRVESDGIRLTVSIGEDPKRRSVDAA